MIRIKTYSDDTVDVVGVADDAGIHTYAKDGVYAVFVIGGTPQCVEGVRIELHYASSVGARYGGVWSAVIGPLNDTRGYAPPMPAVRVKNDDYRIIVEVDADRGTPVVYGRAHEVDGVMSPVVATVAS